MCFLLRNFRASGKVRQQFSHRQVSSWVPYRTMMYQKIHKRFCLQSGIMKHNQLSQSSRQNPSRTTHLRHPQLYHHCVKVRKDRYGPYRYTTAPRHRHTIHQAAFINLFKSRVTPKADIVEGHKDPVNFSKEVYIHDITPVFESSRLEDHADIHAKSISLRDGNEEQKGKYMIMRRSKDAIQHEQTHEEEMTLSPRSDWETSSNTSLDSDEEPGDAIRPRTMSNSDIAV
jgi:hypothetical protein